MSEEEPRAPWPGEDNATLEARACPVCGHWRTLYKRKDGTVGPCAECDPTCSA